jgi:AcrR family transcriptional regulator
MPRTLSRDEVDRFKQQLCEAAERLIQRKGGLDFTMRELAAELGCSPMLPYRYYKDKDEIIAAVRTGIFRRFAAALEAPQPSLSDPTQRSREVGEAYVAFAFANPKLYRLMFDLAPVERGRYPDLDEAMTRARATMTSHVGALVESGLLIGDPVVIGHLFWSSLHGLIVLKLAGQLSPDPGFQRLRAAQIDALVNGLRAR